MSSPRTGAALGSWLAAVAALCVGIAVGFLLVDPGAANWGIETGSLDFGWSTEAPVVVAGRGQWATAVGLLAAVGTAGAARLLRRRWAAWALALAGALALGVWPTGLLTSVAVGTCLTAVAAGLALGAMALAVWPRRLPSAALLAGALLGLVASSDTGALAGLPRGYADYRLPESVLAWTEWWRWLALVAVLAIAALSCLGRSSLGALAAPDGRALTAGGLAVAGGAGLHELVVRNQAGWGLALFALALLFGLLWVCAELLPGVDGTLLFGALAVTAAAAPVLSDGRMMLLSGQLVAGAILFGVLGAAAGVRWPLPYAGLGVLALTAVAGIPSFDDEGPVLAIRLLAVCAAGAYTLAATRPAGAGGAVAGLAVLLTAFAPAAVAELMGGWSVFIGSYEPIDSPPHVPTSGEIHLALILTIGACAVGVGGLTRLRDRS